MPVCTLLFYLVFYHSPSSASLPPPSAQFLFFCSVYFPQLFQMFHRYLWVASRKATLLPVLGVQWQTYFEHGGRLNSRVKTRFIRNQSTHGWCLLYCAVGIYFKMIGQSNKVPCCEFRLHHVHDIVTYSRQRAYVKM